MRLEKACKIGKDCGVETIEQVFMLVELHAMCMFKYDEIDEELNEMYKDYKNSGLNENSSIYEVLKEV